MPFLYTVIELAEGLSDFKLGYFIFVSQFLFGGAACSIATKLKNRNCLES